MTDTTYEKLTRAELVELADARGLPKTGTRGDIVERLLNDDAERAATEVVAEDPVPDDAEPDADVEADIEDDDTDVEFVEYTEVVDEVDPRFTPAPATVVTHNRHSLLTDNPTHGQHPAVE